MVLFYIYCIYGIYLFDDNNLEAFEDISKIEETVNLKGINNNELGSYKFINLSTSLLIMIIIKVMIKMSFDVELINRLDLNQLISFLFFIYKFFSFLLFIY